MNKRKIILKIKSKYLWIREVLLLNHTKKISPYHKLRAIRYGFSSDFYILYNLKRNNPANYISEYQRVLGRETIDGDYLSLMDNKIIFTEFFGNYVKVPKIKYYILDEMYDERKKRITFEGFLNEFKNTKYIIKPNVGGGGHGVHIIEENNGKYFVDYKRTSKNNLETLFSKSKNSIINECIHQDNYASKIWSKSVNTIRIVTMRDPKTQKYVIPFATHRFGNSKTGAVDNASSGGIITRIDVETGELKETKKRLVETSIFAHPDTGEKISGIKIPNWQKIKQDLLVANEKMPYIPFIAWDVAVINDKDYVIIETNASSGFDLVQPFGSLKGTELWNFYKHYGIVK